MSELEEAFNEFLKMRKAQKKPATERAVKALKKKLNILSCGDVETAIAIIDQSIVKCWLDFYPLKDITMRKSVTSAAQNLFDKYQNEV